jgi:hypothetical protein
VSSVGVTNIIVNASILDPIRLFIHKRSKFFSSLIGCMLCSGFWVGFFSGILPYMFAEHYNIIYTNFGIIFPCMFAPIVSISSSFYDIFTDYLILNKEE